MRSNRKKQGMGTHSLGTTGKAFEDVRQMFYFEQDGKLCAHSGKKDGIAYLGRHAAIQQFGRKGLYAARGYKRVAPKPVQEQVRNETQSQ